MRSSYHILEANLKGCLTEASLSRREAARLSRNRALQSWLESKHFEHKTFLVTTIKFFGMKTHQLTIRLFFLSFVFGISVISDTCGRPALVSSSRRSSALLPEKVAAPEVKFSQSSAIVRIETLKWRVSNRETLEWQ